MGSSPSARSDGAIRFWNQLRDDVTAVDFRTPKVTAGAYPARVTGGAGRRVARGPGRVVRVHHDRSRRRERPACPRVRRARLPVRTPVATSAAAATATATSAADRLARGAEGPEGAGSDPASTGPGPSTVATPDAHGERSRRLDREQRGADVGGRRRGSAAAGGVVGQEVERRERIAGAVVGVLGQQPSEQLAQSWRQVVAVG